MVRCSDNTNALLLKGVSIDMSVFTDMLFCPVSALSTEVLPRVVLSCG